MNCKTSKRIIFSLLLLTVFMPFNMVGKTLNLGSLFKNGMVLQRDMKVPIWGTATPGSVISVEFAGQNKSVKTNIEGKWILKLDKLKASLEPQILRVTEKNNDETEEIECSDVLVGEVWICSGQSNMQLGYNGIPNIKALVPDAKNIRTFNVFRTVAFNEQDTCKGEWVNKVPSSAVAFTFSYFLEKKMKNVPIGIILNPWGSSSIEAWMPKDMGKEIPYFKKMMDDFDANKEFKDRIQSILDGPKPWPTKDDIFLRRQSNILYNAMMKPLIPFACRGIVWYQGERNTQSMFGEKKSPWWSVNSGMLRYGDVLKKMILRYRKEWNKKDLQFMVVMLPGYAKDMPQKAENPDTRSWAWMRESQMKVMDLPHTSVINTIDLGELKQIHCKDKIPVGQRLALCARKNIFGEKIVASGPMMSKVIKHQNKLIVHFKNADGLKTKDGKSPSGFWLSDDNAKWYPANAKIDGKKVVLQCPKLPKPLYVRYAFSGKPKVNLVNEDNLPAFPFRTDKFKP